MSEILLDAKRREPGRSTARALRRQGIVPGIFYYHGEEPIPVAATELALRPLIYTTESHIVSLKLDDGTSKSCILKDITFDPITDRPTHFDLQGVAANEAIKVEVPVVLVGSAAGVRDGGVVDFIQHKLEIECFPRHLPEHIEVDVTELHIGDSIHVRDLSIENVTILTPEEATVVLVAAPRVVVDTTSTELTSEEMQPELVTRGGEAEG